MSGLRAVTVRQLQIFHAAARHASFSQTSRALHLTQPAVSMQIRQLEESAGLPLFDRTGKRLRLTEAGEEMLRCAQQVISALHDAEDAFARLKGVRGGRIAIAVVSTAKYFAPRLLAMFAAGYPGVTVKLSVNNREEVIGQLVNDEIDVAIMGTAPAAVEATAESFARHPLVIISAPGHPLASRRRLTMKSLEGETFLIRESGSGTRSAMERFFASQRFRMKASMEMSSNETIKQAVMAGLGIAFISEHTIGLEIATGQVKVLPVDGLPVVRQWNLVHRRDKRLSPAAQAFKDFVLREGAEFLARWPTTSA